MAESPRLADVLPGLAERLAEALREQARPYLANQVADLRIEIACGCEEERCGSFYTTKRPMQRWLRRGESVPVEADLPGEVTIDVVGGSIVYVEVLFWEGVRDAIRRAAPRLAR